MAPIYKVPLSNNSQYTLDTQYTAGGTSLVLNTNVASVVQAPGTCVVDRVDSSGNKTASKRTYYTFTGVSTTTLTGLAVADGTDQAHAVGAIVEFVPDITWAQSVYNGLSAVVDPATQALDTTKVVDLTTAQTISKKTIKSSLSEVVTTAGGTTTYTLTPSVAIAAYATGQEFVIKMNASNTGASTINVSGLGAKSLTRGGATALASGDLLIDAVYKIVYDGTQFQVSGISAATTAATRAEVATGTSSTLMLTPQNTHEFHVPPQGFLYNGKIVPSVSSNNLTVALKGLDGNDPSVTNPVYVRIGDTVRTITAALSVTKNAGINWCDSGNTSLATFEIDYFVYLGYNATDGVVIGFSRAPFAGIYSDFSVTTTDERYCAISTITNAAASDNYVVVGRFAATNSGAASYNWSVPTFTGLNLIQYPIYFTRTLSMVAFPATGSGFSGGTNIASYRVLGDRVWVSVSIQGRTQTGTTGIMGFNSAWTNRAATQIFGSCRHYVTATGSIRLSVIDAASKVIYPFNANGDAGITWTNAVFYFDAWIEYPIK